MQANIFVGYFENGIFYTNDRQVIEIPEKFKIHLTLFDERIDNNAVSGHSEKRPFSDMFGEWNGKIWMSDDFDEPLAEMRDYM